MTKQGEEHVHLGLHYQLDNGLLYQLTSIKKGIVWQHCLYIILFLWTNTFNRVLFIVCYVGVKLSSQQQGNVNPVSNLTTLLGGSLPVLLSVTDNSGRGRKAFMKEFARCQASSIQSRHTNHRATTAPGLPIFLAEKSNVCFQIFSL